MARGSSTARCFLGGLAERLRRAGISTELFLAGTLALSMVAQFTLLLRLPMSSHLLFAIIAAAGATTVLSFAILQDESGIHSLLHLADTEDDAARWLDAHPHRNARIVPAGAPEPRLFTYLQDPGHGWLIVSGADLAAAGMTRAEFSICSYASGDSLALEEDCDMPLFLKRLDERGIAWRLREHHTNADARVRCWESNLASEARSAGRPPQT